LHRVPANIDMFDFQMLDQPDEGLTT